MENTRIVELQRKTNLKADEIQLFKESFVIVPYQSSGFLNYTNQGYNQYNINPNDFETFKRIGTGNDACVLSWKGSVQLTPNENNELEINYQLGEVILGVLQVNDSENRIINDVSFSEYKAQEIKKTISFYVNKRFNITDYYQLLFYKIPEYSGSTLYRLSNIERDFVGNEIVGYVLTFETINQDLANTGKAKQQNIMPNSPGQGYLECVVEDKDGPNRIGLDKFNQLKEGIDYYKLYDRYITADYTKTLNNPVCSVIVKLLGVGTLITVAFEGRPVYIGDSFKKYRDKRLIFTINYQVPTTPNLFHTQNNTNNFYFGKFSPTLDYGKDLMNSIKDSLTPINRFNYQGGLKYDYAKLQLTNPINEENQDYSNTLYGSWNGEKAIFEPWKINIEPEIFNTEGVYGLNSRYQLGGGGVSGNTKTIYDLFFDNFGVFKMMKVLPTTEHSTLSMGWTLASAVGLAVVGGTTNYINAAILGAIGISGILVNALKPKNNNSIYGIISAPFLDFNHPLYSEGSLEGKIPFNFLDSNNDDTPNTIFFSGRTLATSFQANLTEFFQQEGVIDNRTLSTINIGQTTFEDGTNIQADGTPLLLDGKSNLVNSTHNISGYIIDNIKIASIFNGDISIEFLDNQNQVVGSGVYQSEGKWTNSMREIGTEKNTSVFNQENVYFGAPVSYPQPIPAPNTTNKEFLERIVDVNGLQLYNSYKLGIGYVSVRNETQIENHNTHGWKSRETNVNVSNKVIVSGYSKEDLLNGYSMLNIELNYGTINYNVYMNELANNNGNYVITRDKVFFQSKPYDVAISFLPIIPSGENRIYLSAYFTHTIRIYYDESDLSLKFDFESHMLQNQPDLDMNSAILADSEVFLFGTPYGSFSAGITKMMLYLR